MTKQEFSEIAAYIDAGTGHKFDKAKLLVWYDVLGDLPVASLKAAARRCLQECEGGFPQPATLRRMAIEFDQGVLPDADTAWRAVLDAASRFGRLGVSDAVKSLDPVAVEAIGGRAGFIRLSECDNSQLTFLSAQFRRAYESLSSSVDRKRRLSADVCPKDFAEINNNAIEFAAKRMFKNISAD